VGLFDKFMGMVSGESDDKSEGKKQEIRGIFDSKMNDGENYTVLAGTNMVTTKKLLKEVRTYYNYLIGYKDGDDAEIVFISASPDLSSTDEPVICKKSECTEAVYLQNTGSFTISHPRLGDRPVDFSIIASAAWGESGAGLVIPVSYRDEYMPFAEFFQNRFAK
jgi:hypothetical protein